MTSCTELLEALDKARTLDGDVPPDRGPAEWRRAKAALSARTVIIDGHFAACVKALEGQELLLNCLETVCVGLPPADREAANNFIDQLAAPRCKALAALRRDLEAALEVK